MVKVGKDKVIIGLIGVFVIFWVLVMLVGLAYSCVLCTSATPDTEDSQETLTPQSVTSYSPSVRSSPKPTQQVVPSSVTTTHDYDHPVPFNKPVTFSGVKAGKPFQATMTVTEVLRGEDARQLLARVNPAGADDDSKYLLAKVRFTLDSWQGPEDFSITTWKNTSASGSRSSSHEITDIMCNSRFMFDEKTPVSAFTFFNSYLLAPQPAFYTVTNQTAQTAYLKLGETHEGWIVMLADSDDPQPYVVFCNYREREHLDQNNTYVWFSTA